jgi:hypothetical protein
VKHQEKPMPSSFTINLNRTRELAAGVWVGLSDDHPGRQFLIIAQDLPPVFGDYFDDVNDYTAKFAKHGERRPEKNVDLDADGLQPESPFPPGEELPAILSDDEILARGRKIVDQIRKFQDLATGKPGQGRPDKNADLNANDPQPESQFPPGVGGLLRKPGQERPDKNAFPTADGLQPKSQFPPGVSSRGLRADSDLRGI